MFKRGEVHYVRFDALNTYFDDNDCLQLRGRPAIIVSNNVANEHAPIVTVVPLTTKIKKIGLPCHVVFKNNFGKFNMALCEQIHTVPVEDIELNIKYTVPPRVMEHIDKAIMRQLGIK